MLEHCNLQCNRECQVPLCHGRPLVSILPYAYKCVAIAWHGQLKSSYKQEPSCRRSSIEIYGQLQLTSAISMFNSWITQYGANPNHVSFVAQDAQVAQTSGPNSSMYERIYADMKLKSIIGSAWNEKCFAKMCFSHSSWSAQGVCTQDLVAQLSNPMSNCWHTVFHNYQHPHSH